MYASTRDRVLRACQGTVTNLRTWWFGTYGFGSNSTACGRTEEPVASPTYSKGGCKGWLNTAWTFAPDCSGGEVPFELTQL